MDIGDSLLKEGIAIAALIGSFLLLLYLEPPQGSIKELRMGEVYKVCAVLIPLKNLNNGCLYRAVDDSGEIKAVAFFGGCRGGYACFYGRVDEYRGEREVVILSYT